MNLKDILAKRRSTRKFLDQAVPKEVIDRVLDSALQVPSSRNSHSTKFAVVTDPEKITKLSTMRDYGSSFMKAAPCAIVVIGDTTATDLWEVNCTISATVLQLACVDEGLASCWVHVEGRPQFKDAPEQGEAIEVVRKVLDIPQEHKVLCIIACGYSDFEPAALPEWDKLSKITYVK